MIIKHKINETQSGRSTSSWHSTIKVEDFLTVISVIDKLTRPKKWQWVCSGFEENKFDPISMHGTLHPTVIEYIFF